MKKLKQVLTKSPLLAYSRLNHLDVLETETLGATG